MNQDERIKQLKASRPSYFQSESEQESEQQKTQLLKFQETSEGMTGKSRSLTRNYLIDDILFFTNQIRLFEIVKQITQKPSDASENQDDQHIYKKEEQKSVHRNYNQRYYNMEGCLRCKQFGHIARFCQANINNICQNCMRRHPTVNCTDIICELCGQIHAIQTDCNVDKNIKCRLCEMRGHSSQECGVLVKQPFTQQDLAYTTCLFCKNKGHTNCDKKQRTDDLYKQQKSVFQKYRQMESQLAKQIKDKYHKGYYK